MVFVSLKQRVWVYFALYRSNKSRMSEPFSQLHNVLLFIKSEEEEEEEGNICSECEALKMGITRRRNRDFQYIKKAHIVIRQRTPFQASFKSWASLLSFGLMTT